MKKTLVVLLTFVICFGSIGSFADTAYFDTTSVDRGIISVSYQGQSGQHKVMVQKGSEKVFIT